MIRLVVVGKVKAPFDDAVREYEARAGRYWKLSIAEVPAGAGHGRRAPADEVREAEAERIEGRLDPDAELWLSTRDGSFWTSGRLAQVLGKRQLHGARPLVIAIGGAFGFAPGLRERADRMLSLSSFTLPHEMARLVWAEQLYRAGTILRGEPYHKGGET